MFRVAATATVALLWCQFLLTSRWAHVEGSIHGPKRPYYLLALVVLSLALATWKRRSPRPTDRWERPVGVAGLTIIAVGILVWFPPSSWTQIPYLDNWATRFQTTIDGIQLLRQGSATGWNWYFLGGYPSATDITQSLTLLALAPIAVFGAEAGFHVLHVVLLFSAPLLVFADLRLAGERSAAWFALGMTCATVAGLSYPLFRSGDTNSLAGICLTMTTIVCSHAARTGRRWGGPLLVASLIALAWSHVGFLIYASLLLAGDVIVSRAWRHLRLVSFGIAVAFLAALPLTWELWRYPSLFLPNNVRFDPGAPVEWEPLARQIFYNLEMWWLPGRWFNDYGGLTRAFLPLLVWVAIAGRNRMRFYAGAAILMMALLCLNAPVFGYVFERPVHLLSVLTPVAIAGLLTDAGASTWRRLAVVAFVLIYVQIWWRPVPHIADRGEVAPALVAHVTGAGGNLILVENTFHRDMDRSPDRTSEATPVPVHLERMLALVTGRRLYAGMWDGMQWVPYRERLLSGGTFHGAPLAETPYARFNDEMRRWGVTDLAVWSHGARTYLDEAPGYVRSWTEAPWHGYRLLEADARAVETTTGVGQVADVTPFGANVVLTGVQRGERVVVRTSYHPAWVADTSGETIPLVDVGGQLAFDVPRTGNVSIRLSYPRRTGLLWFAGVVALIGTWVSRRLVASPDR